MKLGMRSLPPSEMRSLSPAPLVVDVTAEAKGLAACLERTAPDGICSSAGGLHSSARIPFVRTYIRNATLHLGRTHARAVIPDVLALLADGFTTAQVADRLSVSEHTVRSRIKAILSKLGARNREHAVAKAIRQGVV